MISRILIGPIELGSTHTPCEALSDSLLLANMCPSTFVSLGKGTHTHNQHIIKTPHNCTISYALGCLNVRLWYMGVDFSQSELKTTFEILKLSSGTQSRRI